MQGVEGGAEGGAQQSWAVLGRMRLVEHLDHDAVRAVVGLAHESCELGVELLASGVNVYLCT